MVYKQISYSKFCELFTFDEEDWRNIHGEKQGEPINAKIIQIKTPFKFPLFGGYKTQVITAIDFDGIAAYEVIYSEIGKPQYFDHYNYYISKEFLLHFLLSSSASADFGD